MSMVGLTKAMREAFEHIRDGCETHRELRMVQRTAPELYNDEGEGLTPRGHAALAAPRMTHFQYDILCKLERGDSILLREYNQFAAACWKGWVDERGENLSDAGRTALNNVRAAMPGEWRQVGSPDWKEGL